MDPHPHVASAALDRARWATRLQFMALGILRGTWGAHIPSVMSRYGISVAALSMILPSGHARKMSPDCKRTDTVAGAGV